MKSRSIVLLFILLLIIIIASSFLIEGVRNVFIRMGILPGRLEILGAAPQVIEMYVNTTPTAYQAFSPIAPGPQLIGEGDWNTTYILNATVYDINGDCDGSFTWYICTNDTGTICNTKNYAYSVSSTDVTKFGASNEYCNFTATFFGLEYYRPCGLGRVNGTAIDIEGNQNHSTMMKYWKYNGFTSILFPYIGNPVTDPAGLGNEINFGSVYVGQWNEERGENITKNGGNVQLTLRWNATNFTCTSPATCGTNEFDIYVIEPPTNTTFAVDNTSIRADTAGYINETEYYRIVYPEYNLTRCGNYFCSLDEDLTDPHWANFTLWWHVYIPSGTLAGTYQNWIELDITQATICE